MTRNVTISADDAAVLSLGIAEYAPDDFLTANGEALTRFADALDAAEAAAPSGLFPDPVIIGPSGTEHPLRGRS